MRTSLKEALKDVLNKDITNKQTGMVGRISSTGMNKISSTKALNKSLENGFTKEEHYKAGEHIKQLFETAKLREKHADSKGRPNIAQVYRFERPLVIDNKEAIAKITMFEKIEGNNRVYSLELESLESNPLSSNSHKAGLADNAQYDATARTEAPTIAKSDELDSTTNTQNLQTGASHPRENLQELEGEKPINNALSQDLSYSEIPQDLQVAWIKEFNLQSIDDEFVPSFKPEVKEALEKAGVTEDIKLTKGSLVKLVRENRFKYLDRIKPTLQEPDRIVKQDDITFIFAKDFGEEKYFTSVAKDDNGEWVITSNAPKSENGLNNKIAKGGEEIYNKQAGSQINASTPYDDVANSNTKLDKPDSTTTSQTPQTLTKQQAYHKIVGEYGKIFKKLPKVLADKDIDSILRDTKTLADIRKRSFDERGFNPRLAELAAQDYFRKDKAITAFIYKAREYGLDLGFNSFMQFFKKRYGTQIKNDEQAKDMLASLNFFKSLKIEENPQRFTDIKMSEDKSGFVKYVEDKIDKYLGIDEMAKKLTHNPKFDELQAMLDLYYQAKRITKNPKDIQKVEQYANTLRPFFPSLVNKNTSDFLYEIDNLAYSAHNLLQSKVYISLDSDFYPAREAIEYFLDIKPIKEFGTNYAEYYRDGQRGIEKLLAEAKDYEARKQAGKLTQAEIEQGAYKGQVAGAFHKEGLGDIDVVWGDSHFGLQHILERRTQDFIKEGLSEAEAKAKAREFVESIPHIIENGKVEIIDKRAFIYYDDKKRVIALDYKGDDSRKWLLTAYKNDEASTTPANPHQSGFADKDFSTSSKSEAKDNSTTNSIKLQANSHIGTGLASGTLAGLETDENGNIIGFDPQKFALGFLGGSAGSIAFKKGKDFLDKNPKYKEAIKKELADTLAKGWENASAKYPLLDLIVKPQYIMQNEKARVAQAGHLLKEAEAQNYLKILHESPAPIPKEVNIQEFLQSVESVANKENFIKHLENSTDFKQRLAYLNLVEPTLKEWDIKLDIVNKNKIPTNNFIKAFKGQDNVMYYIAITKETLFAPYKLLTGFPTTKIREVLKRIKEADNVTLKDFEKARDLGGISSAHSHTSPQLHTDIIAQKQENISQLSKKVQKKFNYDEKKAKDLLEWHKNSSPITKDKDGLPKVFYHGSGEKFEVFEKRGWGIWLTPNQAEATFHKDRKTKGKNLFAEGENPTLYTAFVKIKNPFTMDMQITTNGKFDDLVHLAKEAGLLKEEEYIKYKDFQKAQRIFNRIKRNTKKLGYEFSEVNRGKFVGVDKKNNVFIAKDLADVSRTNETILAEIIHDSIDLADILGKNQWVRNDFDLILGLSKNNTDDLIDEKFLPYLKSKGYDGMKVNNLQFVVFDSKQIKHIKNKGSYIDESGNITSTKPKDTEAEHRYFNEKSPNIFYSNQHLGTGLASGTLAGLETDENGNIIGFNPQKFALGFLGGVSGSVAVSKGFKLAKAKYYEKNFSKFIDDANKQKHKIKPRFEITKELEKEFRENKVNASKQLLEKLHIEDKIYADYITLAQKHPEYFANPMEAKALTEYIAQNPSTAIPATKKDYELIFSEIKGGKGVFALDLELKGGKHRIRSLHLMKNSQYKKKLLEAKKLGEPVLQFSHVNSK